MKKGFFIILLFAITLHAQVEFKINYEMAQKCVNWLEFINTGADKSEIKKYFMDNVAVTEGCQTIIAHWSRFREWNNDIFFEFILEALGLIESNKPLYNDDGSLTSYGKRSMYWKKALKNPLKIQDNIHKMKSMNLEKRSLEIASKYLPEDTEFQNVFYVVLFGASNAFSVGDRNGFDILQLPQDDNGNIDEMEILELFAHELHHTGFNYLVKKLNDSGNMEQFTLIGILAAEGMPTYFINMPFDKIEKLKNSPDPIKKQFGMEWEDHLANMKNYYKIAEEDILKNLKGELKQRELMESWMSGLQGKAYALGSDMFSVIEKYSGFDNAIKVAYDYRKFIEEYNIAAKKGNELGDDLYVFSDELINAIRYQIN
jgi:hypothetical protein